MPTNIIDAGPARTYGSSWSIAGRGINEGLQSVLGYYQEYTRQKRFEQQQKQEMERQKQQMADRAEEKNWINEERTDIRNARQAQNAEQDALRLTPEQALAMPEYTTETKTMVPNEMLKMTTPGSAELGIKEETVEMPSFSQKEELKKELLRTKKYGNYTAVLDYGGEQARKAGLQKDIAEGKMFKNSPALLAAMPPAARALYANAEYVPGSIAGPLMTADRAATKPDTQVLNGALYERQQDGSWKSVAREAKQSSGDGSSGGAYKSVYDKQTKEDTMANDAMIAENPGRYGPARKENGQTGYESDIDHLAKGGTLASIPKARQTDAAKAAREAGVIVFETPKQKAAYEVTTQSLSEAEELKELLLDQEVKDSFGAFAGRWNMSATAGWASVLPGDIPPSIRRAFQIAQNLNDLRLRQRSGAAISKDEATRLGKFSFDPTIPAEQMTVNIDPFIAELKSIQAGQTGQVIQRGGKEKDPYDDIDPAGAAGGASAGGKKDPGGLRNR